ncbi:PLC-like phosphodiesterase [Mycena pura]|uniref:Phosphoinositide phospholipase C n=1 Tax=Mycena pura TaxID=153505 RepID=A0AAD6YNC3_9AGAR|nr:PLC-like phosphodiesterase [Mycena pura]
MATDNIQPIDSMISAATQPVPLLLKHGIEFTKVSDTSRKKVIFRIDPDEGQILYESRKHGIVPIETIKEIRTGPQAEYYCVQLGFSKSDVLDRWITIVYVLNSTYKTLHIIAPTRDILLLWESTVQRLYSIRLGLMHSSDNSQIRQTVWEMQYWKGADKGGDKSLSFDELRSMCVRLNVSLTTDRLEQLFKEVDVTHKKSLNFQEFQQFVKLIKRRPELETLYKTLCGDRPFDFSIFEKFMKDTQKSTLNSAELKAVFEKYATTEIIPATASSAPPIQPISSTVTQPASSPQPSVLSTPPVEATTSPMPPTVPVAPTAPALPPVVAAVASTSSDVPPSTAPVSHPSATAASAIAVPSRAIHIMSLENFTTCLMSQDNAAARPESNDMTQPMADYFISTSHNTYLVGNQLMGFSTVEGYIRALLCGCRSVELDIYDGPYEPMVYHGKTLTARVSVRDICCAIAKYAFVASPYPVLLSCEVHCGLTQQDMLVDIMTSAFGPALVRIPPDEEHVKIAVLPSPEQLKGRIMVKTKNLYLADGLESIRAHKKVAEAAAAKAAHLEVESSSETSSDYEWEPQVIMDEVKEEISELKTKWRKLRGVATPSNSGAVEPSSGSKSKVKAPMSLALASLLVYTVGVKYRGVDKDDYAPEQIFSLSESKANECIKGDGKLVNLIRHTQKHVVRIYPKGTRVSSTNYEPLQYWAAGCQLVALNIQTMDRGYRINQGMFMRCGRQGYVLKPPALRDPTFQEIRKYTQHFFDVTIISAQQLPLPKDSTGREIIEKSNVDPYVEVVLHIPAWSHPPFLPELYKSYTHIPPSDANGGSTTARKISFATGAVKDNGFNPTWQEELCLPFDCVGGMKELVFVEFIVKQDKKPDAEPLASYIAPLSSLEHGFRHLPLHDVQLCAHLFSTLFVFIHVRDV